MQIMAKEKIIIDGITLIVDENGKISRLTETGETKLLTQWDLVTNCPDNCYKLVRVAGKMRLAHRIVLGAFTGGIRDNMVVDHIDGDKSNNKIGNLRWVTVKENVHNVKNSGKCGMPKVNEWLIDNKGYDSWKEVAEVVGVTYNQLKNFLRVYKNALHCKVYHDAMFSRKECAE